MDPRTIFILEIRSSGVAVNASWNQIPLYDSTTGDARIVQSKLNPFVTRGDNEARILFRQAPPSPGKTIGQSYVRVRVIRTLLGDSAETTISEFQWTSEQGPLPRAWRDSVRVGDAFGRWTWESAPRAPLSRSDRQQILATLNRVRDALLAADAAQVIDLFRVKNEEMARALNMPLVEVVSGMTRSLEPFFAAPERVIEPLVEAGLLLTVVAEGRLIGAASLEGEPALRGRAGDTPFKLPVMLTRSGREWVIAR